MNEIKKTALGRGLSSLLDPSGADEAEGEIKSLPLSSIQKGQFQPRSYFPEEDLQELADSIRERGVLQPVLVRIFSTANNTYELIAGERRWRAAKIAGISEIPVIVRDFSDSEALEVGLLENIQRQDLNPLEEAEGYRRLAEDFNHTQESLSRILGKSRSYIANSLRLLTLPQAVKDLLREGKLSAGHSRALIGTDNPEQLAKMIVDRGLSVREIEALAKEKKTEDDNGSSYSHRSDPEKDILKEQLSSLLGRNVDLILKGVGGKIIIPFKNPTELDSLIRVFDQLSFNNSNDSNPSSPTFKVWS